MTYIRLHFLIPACLAAVILGCNDSSQLKGLVPVEGKLMYKSAPVGEAQIRFIPVEITEKSRSGGALTLADGAFQAMTLQPEDGLFPGEYIVTVTKSESVYPSAKEMDAALARNIVVRPKVTHQVPVVYSDHKTTPLRLTIDPKGEKELVIELQEAK